MRLSVLTFWVVGLVAVIHYCTLGPVDLTSYLGGVLAAGMVMVITWDSRVEAWEVEEG